MEFNGLVECERYKALKGAYNYLIYIERRKQHFFYEDVKYYSEKLSFCEIFFNADFVDAWDYIVKGKKYLSYNDIQLCAREQNKTYFFDGDSIAFDIIHLCGLTNKSIYVTPKQARLINAFRGLSNDEIKGDKSLDYYKLI